jgi:uncharacterized protein (UPF0297 family)
VESYKRLKLFEKDAPVDSTSKPKKKIVKKVVKKVAKAIQDTADDKSNQIIGVSESTKTTITPSTKQQIDGQAPKKIVKKIVKKVVKKNPAAENQESLAIDKNLSDLTPVTNSEPQEAKKTVKKIIKKVVKKKQVVDALTQGADQQEPAQEGQTD